MKTLKNLLRIQLSLILLVITGCGQRDSGVSEELRITADVDMELLAHKPSKNLDQAIERVDEILAKVHGTSLPKNLPNWIAFHASLMYGPTVFQENLATRKADENIARVRSITLHSDTSKSGPFVLRGGNPYPRTSGERFMTEHHPDQFLNYFSMGGATLETQIVVDDQTFTLFNLLQRSLLEARPTNELAFTILAYSHYLQPSKRWENKFGEQISFATLLEQLLKRDEVTCGGAHRMGALARTLSHEQLCRDPEMVRLWPELERQVGAALVNLKQNQREDGGFMLTNQLAGSKSLDHQDVYYSGHCIEWITLCGNREHLTDEWVVRAILRLTDAIEATYREVYRDMDMIRDEATYFDFDGLCHALSGLRHWRASIGLPYSPPTEQ